MAGPDGPLDWLTLLSLGRPSFGSTRLRFRGAVGVGNSCGGPGEGVDTGPFLALGTDAGTGVAVSTDVGEATTVAAVAVLVVVVVTVGAATAAVVGTVSTVRSVAASFACLLCCSSRIALSVASRRFATAAIATSVAWRWPATCSTSRAIHSSTTREKSSCIFAMSCSTCVRVSGVWLVGAGVAMGGLEELVWGVASARLWLDLFRHGGGARPFLRGAPA